METRYAILLLFVLVQAKSCLTNKLLPNVHATASYTILEDSPSSWHESAFTNTPAKSANPKSLQCGDVFAGSNGSSIVYKPYEQVADYERCVWIIAAPNATGYSIDLIRLGSPTNKVNSTQELIFTGLQHGGLRLAVKPTGNGTFTIDNVNLLVFTFWSENNGGVGNGFIIRYRELITDQINKISTKSSHHIFESTVSDFKYPVSGSTYDNMELAALAFAPTGNVYTGNCNVIRFTNNELAEACQDFVNIFILNTTLSGNMNKWQLAKRLCDTDDTYELTHDDFIFVLFQSNEETVGQGFSLNYTGCS